MDLDACYANAYANSLWGWGYVGSYSMTNSDEYFANGLMTYFDVQYPYDQVDDHSRQGLSYLSILDLVVSNSHLGTLIMCLF